MNFKYPVYGVLDRYWSSSDESQRSMISSDIIEKNNFDGSYHFLFSNYTKILEFSDRLH